MEGSVTCLRINTSQNFCPTSQRSSLLRLLLLRSSFTSNSLLNTSAKFPPNLLPISLLFLIASLHSSPFFPSFFNNLHLHKTCPKHFKGCRRTILFLRPTSHSSHASVNENKNRLEYRKSSNHNFIAKIDKEIHV